MSSKRTVVVVDDDPYDKAYLCFDEGLAALRKHQPDLLLTDYVLDRPHSGTELIREGNPAVAIVVSSKMDHLTKESIESWGENTVALAKKNRAGILAAIKERLEM